MMKFRILLAAFVITGVLTACSQNSSDQDQTMPAETTEIQETTLGANISVIEEKFGPNSGDGTLASFQDEAILGIFADKTAFNLTYQFEATDQPRRSKEDALMAANELMPADAVEVKNYKDESNNREVVVYKSETLATALTPASFKGEEPGTFIAILNYDDQGVFSAVIAPGNNP
jgi:hypothetical protein